MGPAHRQSRSNYGKTNVCNSAARIRVASKSDMNEHVQTDINIASFLLQRGFRLLEIRYVASGRYGFVFDDPRDEAIGAATEFLADSPAPARSLLNCLRTLKAQLFREKNEYEHQTPRSRS